MSHAPQCAGLFERSAQTASHAGIRASPQAAVSTGQPISQTPPTHALPGQQVVPQALQFSGSLSVSTHALPHIVVPGGHVQKPPTQLLDAVQTVPHDPQFVLSRRRSLQPVLQSESPPGQIVPPPVPPVVTVPPVENEPPVPPLKNAPPVPGAAPEVGTFSSTGGANASHPDPTESARTNGIATRKATLLFTLEPPRADGTAKWPRRHRLPPFLAIRGRVRPSCTRTVTAAYPREILHLGRSLSPRPGALWWRPMRTSAITFADGAATVFSAIGMLVRTPSLWPWALVPTFILALLESGFIALAVFVLRPEVLELLPEATTFWTRVGAGAASVAVVAGTAVIGWFISLLLAPPLSAPALEHLVSRVEMEIGAPPRVPVTFIAELMSGFRAMLGAALVGGPILILLSIVELVAPPAAAVTIPLKLVTSSLLIAWGLFDYPLSLRGIGFRERLRLMGDHAQGVLGFGLTFTVIFWIPCCGVIFLPVGAIAATMVVCRIIRAPDGAPR
jgi:uncharacterized protein involved in cysteine biosynthesis